MFQTLSLTISLCPTVIGEFIRSQFFDEWLWERNILVSMGLVGFLPPIWESPYHGLPVGKKHGLNPFSQILYVSNDDWTIHQMCANNFMTSRLWGPKILVGAGFLGENRRSMDFRCKNRMVQTISLTISLCPTSIGQFIKCLLTILWRVDCGGENFRLARGQWDYHHLCEIAVTWISAGNIEWSAPFLSQSLFVQRWLDNLSKVS